MNRLDFLASLPFVVSSESTGNTSSVAFSVQDLQLSMEAYKAIEPSSNHDVVPSTPQREESKKDSDDSRRNLLGPIYFTSSHAFPDVAMTNVSVKVTLESRMFLTTINPSSTSSSSANDGFYNDEEDSSKETYTYQILKPPLHVEYIPGASNRPPSLLMHFDVCAFRLFSVQSDGKLESALMELQKRLEAWQLYPNHGMASSSNSATGSFPTTPSTSPPAAQTLHEDEPPSKRARSGNHMLNERSQAFRDTCVYVRNLRTMLSDTSQEGVADTLALLQHPWNLSKAIYCQSQTECHVMQQKMKHFNDQNIQTQTALRQALDAYFPVHRRRAGRRGGGGAAEHSQHNPSGATAAAIGSPSAATNDMLPQVQALLEKHEALTHQKHALGISALPRLAPSSPPSSSF